MDMDHGPCTVDGVNMCHYKNHDEMISRFQYIETQYPDIAKVENYNGKLMRKLSDKTKQIQKISSPGWINWFQCTWARHSIYKAQWECW